jgi:uncharacterized membrane protein YgdD (TMEM256/DUF423 family)
MPDYSLRPHPLLLASTGLSGFIAVALGALAAHPLRDTLNEHHSLDSWHTAAHYQLTHSVAALLVVLMAASLPSLARPLKRIAILWLTGCVLFSGSIYALALGGPRAFGPVTPVGGLAFLAGWIGVIALAITPKSRPPAADSSV